MQIKSDGLFQYMRFMVTPKNSDVSYDKRTYHPPLYYGRDWLGTVKALFWCVISVMLAMLLSGLH
jgi:hypothetical protein